MAGTLKVDLNCDLGESFGRYTLGQDAEIMAYITSANIACGFHAGDPDVIAHTVELAKQNGVAIGAHPGYPDLQGFGRRGMVMGAGEINRMITYQLGALDAFTRGAAQRMVHVKPHGALYNLASQDFETADAIARAVQLFDPNLILVGLAGSELIRSGTLLGMRVANEGFLDRAYLADGQLIPRNQPGAVLTDALAVAENALKLVVEGIVVNGERIKIDTLCLHGDNPEAVHNAINVREVLLAEGIEICSIA